MSNKQNDVFYESVMDLLQEDYYEAVIQGDVDITEFFEDEMYAQDVANSVMNHLDEVALWRHEDWIDSVAKERN